MLPIFIVLLLVITGRVAAGRLLGGIDYTPPVPTTGVFSLTTAPNGGWTSPQYPKAVYYNGYSYFAWVNGSTGAIFVASYDHATRTTSTPVQLDSMGGDVDDHNNPAILIRASDHRIMLAFCLHGGPRMFVITSVNSLDSDPTMTGGFNAALDLDAAIGGNHYTYPALIQLTGVAGDPIYLFYRDQSSTTGRLAYSKVADAGSSVAANWSARTIVLTAASTNRGYWSIASDFDTRIDVMSTDRDAYGSEGAVDMGHMYLDGTDDSWHKSDGTTITATKPFTHSELTQLESNVAGAIAVDGISSVNPVFTYFIDNGDGTVTGKYARWDGAAWDKGAIYTAGHLDLDRFYGYLAINRADNDEVFSGVRTGTETSDLRSYTTADGGATWDSGTDVTSGSTVYNVAAVPVVNGVADMPVIWLQGTWDSSFAFNFAILGLRR